METADTIIKDALQELLVQGVEAPIEADEAQTGIRYLNRMMTMYDADGISLGFTIVSDLGDNVTVPDGAVLGVVKNLAVFLANQFGKPVPQSLAFDAESSLAVMRKLGVSIVPTGYGANVPIGSGNDGSAYVDQFYDDSAEQIATETGAFISVEDDT